MSGLEVSDMAYKAKTPPHLYCPWCGIMRILEEHGGFLEDHCEDHVENGDSKQYDGFVQAFEMEAPT